MKILEIEKPSGSALPIIFDSPHSGVHYPQDFDFSCPFEILQTAEDHYVEDLFSCAPSIGATFLHALFPRSYIDPNRAEDDIDEALLGEPWSGAFPMRPSSRSAAGIGLIRRIVKPGVPVYDRILSSEEIMHRIEQYYRPYHDALAGLIGEAHYNFGQVWHINCHSMPAATAYPRKNMALSGRQPRAADFCIGDRDGSTASVSFTRAIRDFIKGLGYYVTINDPFKGVEILERHACPASGIHSIQLEINKSLYMNETTGEVTGNYSRLKDDVGKLVGFVGDYARSHLTDLAAD